MKKILFLLLALSILFSSSCCCDHEDLSICDLCGEHPDDPFVYLKRVGAVCADCATSPDFTICPSCKELFYCAPWDVPCPYGFCISCADSLTRQCGICEDGPFLKNEMLHIFGCYICADCAYLIALNSDSEQDVSSYLNEHYIYWPEY